MKEMTMCNFYRKPTIAVKDCPGLQCCSTLPLCAAKLSRAGLRDCHHAAFKGWNAQYSEADQGLRAACVLFELL